MAAAVAVLMMAVGVVVTPAATTPALAAGGTICFNETHTGWPKFPAGSVYVIAVHAWWPFPFYFPPPLGCPDNGIYANGIQALTYVTPASLTSDMTICWRWTERVTNPASANLPAGWSYQEGFVTTPNCREFGNRLPGEDGSHDSGRRITCTANCPTPSPTTPAPTPSGRERVYHRVRLADGNWTGWGEPDNGGLTGATSVSAAADSQGQVHFGAVIGGRFFHRIRLADGSWSGWGEPLNTTGLTVSSVAAAADSQGQVHFGAVIGGRFFHRIRTADGNWTGWGDPGGATGPANSVAAALDSHGQLQVATAY